MHSQTTTKKMEILGEEYGAVKKFLKNSLDSINQTSEEANRIFANKTKEIMGKDWNLPGVGPVKKDDVKVKEVQPPSDPKTLPKTPREAPKVQKAEKMDANGGTNKIVSLAQVQSHSNAVKSLIESLELEI